MSYIVLARKWRPKRFAEMVGQEHVLRALSNSLDSGKIHHAFLFTGTRGVGKTTVARILAKSLNCERGVSANPCGECAACREIDEGRFVDLIEVDAASRTKVDDTRELLDNVQYAPTRGRYKVYLIDEVHMLSNHSFNALLKTLEEPPPHVKFLLATTDPQKLPVTVLSRCLQFSLKRLPSSLIAERLRAIAAAEKLEHEPAALTLVARAAEGSMRDALSLLDQLIAFGGGSLSEANTRSMLGTIDRGHVTRLVESLARADGPALLAETAELDRDAPDYDRALVDLAALLQRIAIAQIVPEAAREDEEFDADTLARLAAAIKPEDLQLYYQIALGGRRDLPMAPDPRLGFEMTLLRMLAFRPDAASAGSPRSVMAGPTRELAPPMGERAVPTREPEVPAVTRSAGAPPATLGAPPGTLGAPRGNGAPAAAPAQRAAATASPGEIDPASWPQIVETAGLTGMTRQFALNCFPASLDNDVLILRLDEAVAIRRTPQIEQKLVQALSKSFGRELRVLYEVSNAALATPARQRALADQDRAMHAVAAFEADPAVQGLKERFGAAVDLASVKPAN
jgi:DNA polymerase III subunit gamma/tau